MNKLTNFSRALIAIAMMLGVALSTLAQDFKVNGIYYKYFGAQKVQVTFRGDSYNSYDEYGGTVIIPSSVTYNGITYSVTSIGDNAFRYSPSLTSVTIPNSITSIGDNAFFNCAGLTEVNYNAVNCTSIGGDIPRLFSSNLKTLNIGNEVKNIPNYAFSGCSGLTSVTIPNSVISIGNFAFDGCTNLAELIIEDGNETLSLGYNYYNYYSSLGEGLFYDCPLEKLHLGRNISYNTSYSYGYSPFYNKTKLKEITIGNSVTSINGRVFSGCSGLTKVNYNAKNCTSMGSSSNPVFIGCTNLKTLNIGDEVKTIPNYAFYGCLGLTSVTIPNSVTSIGDDVFSGCNNIKTIVNHHDKTIYTSSIQDFILYIENSDYSNYNVYPLDGKTYNDSELTGDISFSGSGSGTETDPYKIYNPVQLNDVRNSVGHSGIYYKLMNDIDMTEWIADNNPTQGWQPIGNETTMFKGVFIGNGKKITGITINREASSFVGLFGYMNNATISDLTVEGSVIGGLYTGGLVGMLQNSIVANCSFNGDVNGKANVGGLIGNSTNSTISSSTHRGKVVGTEYNIGGLIGNSYCSVVDACSHNGKVEGENSVGGFMGRVDILYSADCSISNSQSVADVVGLENNIGGFIGLTNIGSAPIKSSDKLQFENCSHNGDVSGINFVGGFNGCLEHSSNGLQSTTTTISFNGCSHLGAITGNDNVGGFLGNNTALNKYITTNITNCYSISGIVAEGGNVGGIVGSSAIANITNCYSISDIVAEGDNVGGIVGSSAIANTENNIIDCYFNGKILGKDNVGGIIGKGNKVKISSSYSNALLVNGTNYVGGISGYMLGASTINSCVSIVERINASNTIAGRIYGYVSTESSVGSIGTNVENKGLATSIVNINGVKQAMVDGAQHGTNVGSSTLRLRSSYQGIGWDFSTNWANEETECFPYKPNQTAPPIIESVAVSKATTISGNAEDNAIVYVEVGGKVYSTKSTNSLWSISVDPLQSGDIVSAYSKVNGKKESYKVYKIVSYQGSGTDEDPYLIYTADDLANVNKTGVYKLMNDINLNDWINVNSPEKGWIPIGRNGSVMSKFIGDNHVISGLWMNSTEDNNGLIAAADNIVITDLIVKVAEGKEIVGNNYSGIIIGKITNGSVKNCHSEGVITSSGDYLGGIAGYSSNCSFETCNTVATISGRDNIGGITSNATEYVKDCQSIVTLNGKNYIGGIVANVNGNIEKCVVSANINGTNYLGGIASTSTSSINNCISKSQIYGNNQDVADCFAGGIVAKSSGDILLCSSNGAVSLVGEGNSCYVGGVAGYNNCANIENCYSLSTVESSQYGAGIVGYNLGKINNCYSSGNVSATKYGAGIVGYNDGDNATTSNCVALNNVLAVSEASGIAMRVIGGTKNNAPEPELNNYALATMAVSLNDVAQKIYDDPLHGISKQNEVLMQGNTYVNLGWDFSNVWKINEGSGYPYLINNPKENVKVDSIIINGENHLMIKGTSIVLTTFIFPENSTNKKIKWVSSDNSVATIDEDGKVTALNVGTAIITASATDGSGKTTNCQITVVEDVVNYFSASDISVQKGSNYQLSVEMVNENKITAFQCDVYLPKGISIAMIDDEYDVLLSSRATSSHSIATALQPDGAIRILAYSTTSKAFSENEGSLFDVNLLVSNDYDGSSIIKIANIVMTSPDEKEYQAPELIINADVLEYIIGDTNSDSFVNVTDIVRIANYILGNQASDFVFSAADVSGDGVLNVSDIVGVSNIILNGTTSSSKAYLERTNISLINDCISVPDFTISKGETKTIDIVLNSLSSYTAFQLDIELPEGISLNKKSLTKDISSSHILSSQTQDNGMHRILAYSLSNTEFVGKEILTLEICASETFNGGDIKFQNVLFVKSNMLESKFEDVTVAVPNPSGVESIQNKSLIRVENNNIIINSSKDQVVQIISIDGVTSVFEITTGENIIPMKNSGIYVVKLDNLINKVIIK